MLGTLDVNDQGEVSGQVNFDARVIAQGNHTIHIQGVGTDGFIRAASLGVEVADPPTTAQATDTGGSAVSFIWWALAALLLIAIITAVVLWSRGGATNP